MNMQIVLIERSIKSLENELRISHEITEKNLEEAQQAFKTYSVRTAISKLENVLSRMHRYELRDAQRVALQEVFDSMTEGEILFEEDVDTEEGN